MISLFQHVADNFVFFVLNSRKNEHFSILGKLFAKIFAKNVVKIFVIFLVSQAIFVKIRKQKFSCQL
jgi:hypothetical protein